jgi:hypothetical protein
MQVGQDQNWGCSAKEKNVKCVIKIINCILNIFSVPVRGRICFFFSSAFRLPLGPTKSFIQWLPRVLSQGIKRAVCEADYSPLSSAEVKNGGAIKYSPHTPLWSGA